MRKRSYFCTLCWELDSTRQIMTNFARSKYSHTINVLWVAEECDAQSSMKSSFASLYVHTHFRDECKPKCKKKQISSIICIGCH